MKEMNLRRLMDACCVTIDDDFFDELFDYLMETEVDLNTINIDDLVVNGVQFIGLDELDEDNCYILKKMDDGAYII